MADVPGVARVTCSGIAKCGRSVRAIWTEELQSEVWFCVGDHECPSAVDHRVPGVERADLANVSALAVHANDAVWPVGRQYLACARPRCPAYDPLLLRNVATRNQPVPSAVPTDDPEAVVIKARVTEQAGVIGMELRMTNRVAL